MLSIETMTLEELKNHFAELSMYPPKQREIRDIAIKSACLTILGAILEGEGSADRIVSRRKAYNYADRNISGLRGREFVSAYRIAWNEISFNGQIEGNQLTCPDMAEVIHIKLMSRCSMYLCIYLKRNAKVSYQAACKWLKLNKIEDRRCYMLLSILHQYSEDGPPRVILI
ncbi:MAG: hypothetical protein WCO23_03915 [bacterium]